MSSCSEEKLNDINIRIYTIGQKGFLFDKTLGNILFKKFFGKPVNEVKPSPLKSYDQPFVFSIYEVLYLCNKGLISTSIGGGDVKCSELEDYANKMVNNFSLKYRVYRDLRDKGYIVRSGMKFGADFTVYELGPGLEHAPYVVTVTSAATLLRSIDIVGLGRLSHSVKKKSVLAIVNGNECHGVDINYLVFKWVKP
ncbi:MAG: tRNA-intron lyase [Ignisphaera sp.]|nr:tRNA-intron lyase [Ignisphaera sp.]MCX8168079.1 tRNA-intron lyase [Ignisphaera sp.]MDW8085903.1 tRNA-intron lyase [Ignisphaera sp.]